MSENNLEWDDKSQTNITNKLNKYITKNTNCNFTYCNK